MTVTGGAPVVPVLLDTDAFSHIYVASPQSAQGKSWAAALTGRTVAIAVQTEVELRAWPGLRNWGQPRTAALITRIQAVTRFQVSQAVQDEYVRLTVWAKQNGHAIYDKIHTADRWIAATALAHGLELASGDGGFDHIPNLSLIKP